VPAVPNQKSTHLDSFLVTFFVHVEVTQFKSLRPIPFMQVHEHRLLQLGLTVVHRDRVVVSVETVYKGLNRRLVYVPNIRRRLPRLSTRNDSVRIDQPEGVNNNLAFYRLDRINNNRN
jgi:hypothetical protein